MTQKKILAAILLVILATGAVVWMARTQSVTAPTSTNTSSAHHPDDAANKPGTSPVSPSASTVQNVNGESAKSKIGEIDPVTGKPKVISNAATGPQPTPVKADTNAQVHSVAEALRDKNHPERLSPLFPPKPFDADSYRQNPRAYLDVVEPARAMQAATPGKDVHRIQSLSPQLQDVQPGASITLKVRAAPKWPISFTSTDLGAFENKLTAITVEADETGVAEVKFYATPGTENGCRVMAASPMTSGTVNFQVNVMRAR